MRDSSIILVGMMAVGKTSVGRRLAALREWEFFDSDRQIEIMTGRTVADIWRTDGEPAFRRLEAQVLADALASTTPRVIAAAGGTVLDDNNRRLMAQHHPVVWLRAEPELLATRVGTGSHRPLLDEDPAGVLGRLDAIRRPLYAEVADVVVDVDDLTPDQVVTCIEAALEHGTP
ncbi:MAG: shikimate kinase [Acidimicrobiales bacterium]|nr:shikimate kinase [Acidimicrobiales bacterium]